MLKDLRRPHFITVPAAARRACDLREFDAAKAILRPAEASLQEPLAIPETKRRHALNVLVAAHERLWMLRHGADDVAGYLPPSPSL